MVQSLLTRLGFRGGGGLRDAGREGGRAKREVTPSCSGNLLGGDLLFDVESIAEAAASAMRNKMSFGC